LGAPTHAPCLGDHLTSPAGLTERANTFDERVVLQEFAAHARSGLPVHDIRAQAQRFAERPDVIRTDRDEMTTSELVACERRLIAAALGRAREGVGVVDPDLMRREISAAPFPLTTEQAATVSATIGTGDGVSVIEALAGTGKTFTAGVFGSVYRSAGHEVIGLAPTARAARELSEQAGVPSRTLDRLLLDIEQLGDALPRGCVVILDEAGMAPTRSSARLLELVARARAKVIAIGDPGQLASVQAGGWLRAVGRGLGAQRLTEVMRQRDPHERQALEALHEREPHRFLEWAQSAGRIEAFDDVASARERAVGEWQQAVGEVGPTQAVMIARENETRDGLNTAARELWGALGLLGEICRRNDSRIEVDNGMRGTVLHLESDRVVIETDRGVTREVPASYVAEHLEHAYALTAHGMQGGTVERAIVVASPRDLTAGWSYTALSRARGETRLLIHEQDQATERAEFSPAEQSRTERTDLLTRVARHMRERDDEDLAIEQLPSGPDEIEVAVSSPPVLPQEAARRRAVQRIEDLDARFSTLDAQHEHLARQLDQLPRPPRRRRRDAQALERAHLAAALGVCARELETIAKQRTELVLDIDNPTGISGERDKLERENVPVGPPRAERAKQIQVGLPERAGVELEIDA
jgi:hypothetical protein